MGAYSLLYHTLCAIFVHIVIYAGGLDAAATFEQNFYVTWGHDHIINGGNEVQLLLTNNSGSGFRSKEDFGSGFFEMKIKLPTGRSAGVITTFYLNSILNGFGDHDELDFEFLGGDEVRPILQTNVYTMDNGCREERYILPFDPTADFHKYQILWNQHHIVFFIDDVPIREFKNYNDRGLKYPSEKMHIEATIWDGHVWTKGPKNNITWADSPFRAYYQTFDIHACHYDTSSIYRCYSTDLWWNWQGFTRLNERQLTDMANFRRQYMTYNYCTDQTRNGRPECHFTMIHIRSAGGAASFDQNYYVTWGHNNFINRGHEVELLLTNNSGSGFRSRKDFASGFFEMRIKLPTGRSAGVIATFYLNSILSGLGDHDELDFEFLGSDEARPFLQTNVYTMDTGAREERYNLPFDPTKDFHKYQILWNQHHVVFFIDDIPIREFKNNKHRGLKFPSEKMHIEATIWDAHVWAKPGGGEIDWTYSPFRAHYQTFDIHACQFDRSNCYSTDLWWNWQEFTTLNDKQLADLANFRRQYLTYNYCTDPYRNGHAECHITS